jgi:predicted DNA-binding antitoxin AbrB/MazE fold protein
MPTAVRAIFENGVFKPKEPVDLRDRTEVDIIVSEDSEASENGWQAWDRFAGLWKDAAETDIAENHDKYLNE